LLLVLLLLLLQRVLTRDGAVRVLLMLVLLLLLLLLQTRVDNARRGRRGHLPQAFAISSHSLARSLAGSRAAGGESQANNAAKQAISLSCRRRVSVLERGRQVGVQKVRSACVGR